MEDVLAFIYMVVDSLNSTRVDCLPPTSSLIKSSICPFTLEASHLVVFTGPFFTQNCAYNSQGCHCSKNSFLTYPYLMGAPVDSNT